MRRKLFTLLLLPAFLCGCNAEIAQEKAEVIPFDIKENICYSKEIFEIKGAELASPNQIASIDDMLFICDTENDRVIKCDLQGNMLCEIGGLGTSEGEFVEPCCIAVSSSGICVYDRGSKRIQTFSFNGDFISEFYLSDKFSAAASVVDIAISEEGIVYFSLLSFAKHLSEAGLYTLYNGELTKIRDLAVGYLTANGETIYYMSKYELKNETEWTSGYAEIFKIQSNEISRLSAFSDFYSANGLDFMNEKIYTYNFCGPSLDVFSIDGMYIETLFSEPVRNDFVYRGFCCDDEGNFYLSDSNSNLIYRLVKND